MIWFEDYGELWKLGRELGHKAFFNSFCSLRMCRLLRLLGFFLAFLCILFVGFVVQDVQVCFILLHVLYSLVYFFVFVLKNKFFERVRERVSYGVWLWKFIKRA